MQYMGSKSKIAKHLLPFLLKDRYEGQYFVDLFCGGCNLIDKINGNTIANDKDKNLIALFIELQNGFVPPEEVSKEMYYSVKKNQNDYTEGMVGFVSFLCSFGGKKWGGYAANKKGDNYAKRGSECMVKQIKNLSSTKFYNLDYKEVVIPDKSIVYFDPPYEGTTKYSSSFNHVEMWDYARLLSKNGHEVFVSEYKAPEDFNCLIEIEHKTTLDKNSQYVRIEKLFTPIN